MNEDKQLLGPSGSPATVDEPRNLVASKMKSERPTLREYLRSSCESAARSHVEWQKESPGCGQAAYRSGMWYAYRDIERMIERDEFSPENNT